MSYSNQIDYQSRRPIITLPVTTQQLPKNIESFNEATVKQIMRLKELEGECRIQDFELLKLNYPKAILFGLLMAASVVGLLLLKYYINLRVVLFYSSLNPSEVHLATHIHIKASDKNQSISTLQLSEFEGLIRRVFVFKHLLYQFDQICFPLGIKYIDEIKEQIDSVKGLNEQQAERRMNFLGKNEHLVEVPSYFQYLFDTMVQPFFIFQYIVSAVYILENVAIFGILTIIFGFITTSINYILLYRSYKQIKQSAERHFQVAVLRGGELKTVDNVDLVCGDIYVPGNEIPCDSIIMNGELFVDQSNLTGQSAPIPKFMLINQREIEQSNRWVFEGSIVKKKKEGTLAMAINLGFGSRRGRIIRQILTKRPNQPQLLNKLIYFMVEVLLVSLLLYAGIVEQMMGRSIENIMMFFKLLEFITYSLPAAFPIFFNLAYSFCLIRLHQNGIYGTEAEKTLEVAHTKTICFDKTGTLTYSSMKITSVFATAQGKLFSVGGDLTAHPLIADLFGCCNSVEKIRRDYDGDEIDLEMFHHVKAQIVDPSSKDAKMVRQIQVANRFLEVLRINEYESRFQSMSALYRDEAGRYFVIAKGSPQMVHSYSQTKIQGFDAFIKELSLQGFRSIAFGCRQISQEQASFLLEADREAFLKCISILGVATFVNMLKEDAASTIRTLAESEIDTKIITGDNIFVGVQAALMTGMIPVGIKVVVLQGGKFSGGSGRVEITEIEILPSCEIIQSQRLIENFSFSNSEQDTVYAIDNDFINNNPQTFLHGSIKVFARITPENKGLIIRRHKEIIAGKIKARPFWKRVFGECSLKIGMVGDGANDLIAIKDADMGVAIGSSDAFYSAAFAIKDLSQIVDILCESINTERQIVELTQYYSVINFIYITTTLILLTDVSELTSTHEIYRNFATSLPITLNFALSKPVKQLSKFLPNSNFMGVENHLIFWSNCLILSAGQVGAYLYYYQTDDFVPNPYPVASYQQGWNGLCKSTTVNFLIMVLEYTLLPIFLYRSQPWKEEIYKNHALFFVIVVNLLLIVPIFFETAHLSFLDLLPFDRSSAAVVLAITVFTCVDCGIVNRIIEGANMHEEVTAAQAEEMMIVY